MYRFSWAASFMLAGLLAAGATAQEDRPPGPPDEGGPSPELNLEVLEEFDMNGDGELSGDELGRARRFMGVLRRMIAERVDRPRAEGRRDRPRAGRPEDAGPGVPPEESADGDRPRRDRPRGDRGPRGGDRLRPRADGEGPPDERPRGPRDEPRRLFREFDSDENGQLNPEEFAALMERLNERRGPGGRPGGPLEGRRFGPGGPPDGGPLGRRGGPSAGDRGPEFGGPDGPPPEVDGDGPGGAPERRLRPRDGERRRPLRPDGPRREGPGRPDGDEPAAEDPADGESA